MPKLKKELLQTTSPLHSQIAITFGDSGLIKHKCMKWFMPPINLLHKLTHIYKEFIPLSKFSVDMILSDMFFSPARLFFPQNVHLLDHYLKLFHSTKLSEIFINWMKRQFNTVLYIAVFPLLHHLSLDNILKNFHLKSIFLLSQQHIYYQLTISLDFTGEANDWSLNCKTNFATLQVLFFFLPTIKNALHWKTVYQCPWHLLQNGFI